jgi:MoxR-like ATPase
MDKIRSDELASTGILSTMSRPIQAPEPEMSVVEQFQQLEAHASRLIIGQSHLINRMLIALLCDGHLLVEGAPGLAKTRAIKVLAESIEGDFHRLQFTPDL